MAVQTNLLPSHSEKTLGAMKAERTVKRITFNPTEGPIPAIGCTFQCQSSMKMRSLCRDSLPSYSISILQEGMRTAILFRMSPEHSLTGSLLNLLARLSRTQMGMSFTKSSRTFFSQRMSVKKKFWRASRVLSCARSALMLVTRRALGWMQKTSLRLFSKTNTASSLTTRS